MDYIISFSLLAVYLLLEKIIKSRKKIILIFYFVTFSLSIIGIIFLNNIYLEKFYLLCAIFSGIDIIKILKKNIAK